MVVLVSKEYHCLGDLLLRNRFNTLGASIEAVIGNHIQLQELCAQFQVPFYPVSYENKTKETAENEIQAILDIYQPNYIILAKFMRILSPAFIENYLNSIINIHHSFLPAFIGLKTLPAGI